MLTGKTVLIAGGVGTIGRGLTRSFLNAGARVVANSRSEERLRRLDEDLGKPANLVLIHGTMIPYDGASDQTFKEIFSLVGPMSIDHVISHCGVRWWSPRNVDESGILTVMSNDNVLEMSLEDFQNQSRFLSDFHWNVAKNLVPSMTGRAGTSYTFVTGCTNSRSGSDLASLNLLGVHGLANTLRAQASRGSTGGMNVNELRVTLEVGRPAAERAKDPREVPLSAEIGDITAGIVFAQSEPSSLGQRYDLTSNETKAELMTKFPLTSVEKEIPIMWNFQHAA